jgi:hypothetical protein
VRLIESFTIVERDLELRPIAAHRVVSFFATFVTTKETKVARFTHIIGHTFLVFNPSMGNESQDSAKAQGSEYPVARSSAILEPSARSQRTKSVHFPQDIKPENIVGSRESKHGDLAATAWSGKTLLSLGSYDRTRLDNVLD